MFSFSKSKPGFGTANGCTALVTGSSGLCGARLVEMLLDRGAQKVIAFDLAPPSPALTERFAKYNKNKIEVVSGSDGDLTSDEAVEKVFERYPKINVVFHIAALVGPFHDYDKYKAVNLDGTIRIIEACKKHKVHKLVYSSSPSTRFTGQDVTGQREDELPIPTQWLAMYAETKAYGEMQVSQACSDSLLTISVAPHQVYGPHDALFMPNLLETAGNGRLRVFGTGRSIISTCYVDNYAHGLMCGADALQKDSPALGKFYIVTDGEPHKFWEMINQAVVAMGFVDLYTKMHLPVWFLYLIAYIANGLGYVLGRKFKLNPFNVLMLTMHRYFSIENARKDLGYEPVLPYDEAWSLTIEWFKENWLPGFLERNGKMNDDNDDKKEEKKEN